MHIYSALWYPYHSAHIQCINKETVLEQLEENLEKCPYLLIIILLFQAKPKDKLVEASVPVQFAIQLKYVI